MTIVEVVNLVVLSAVIVGIFLLFLKKRSSTDQNLLNSVTIINDLRKELQESLNSQRRELSDRFDSMDKNLVTNIQQSSSTLQRHFLHTSGIIRDVTEKLTKLDETNKQVLNFSEQLQSLENILKNPKQRGILGEYWLESLLGQVLPPGQYQMQYQLGIDENTGQKLVPDAVVIMKDLLIPIDAKFSLENYNKLTQESNLEQRERLELQFKADVKTRIDETSKYILPEKGTSNFAFMFVPAEGVYHNLITAEIGAVKVNARNLIDYAFSKGVMIVSPTSFFAYLQTVLLGLKALQIEESVKDIQKQAEQMMRHIKTYEDYHNKIGKHLETTVRAYSASSNELKKIDKDIYRITDGNSGRQLEPLEIDTARIDE